MTAPSPALVAFTRHAERRAVKRGISASASQATPAMESESSYTTDR